ncbi:MAG: ABC-type sugar transport system, periplasmic component [Planctomycetota bacterium]|nr:ABC-type sugar transport system, periplasmic component [Planctomycetota bacterium]
MPYRSRALAVAWFLALAFSAGGCFRASEPSGEAIPSRTVKFLGFDASAPLVEAIGSGQLQGIVVQNPFRMGQMGVKTIVDALEKKPVQAKVSTGETLVTRENMKTAEVMPLLNPPKVAHTADSSLTGGKAKKWRILVIPKGTSHEFWKTIHAGASKAAVELGNVEIVWQGPQREDDRTEQIKLVQNAVAAKVDGLVLAPLDKKALVAPVEKAIAAGIPVVIIDSGLDSSKIVSYVATDNYHGGVLAAERMADLLRGEGKIILMRYAVGSESTEQRESGFVDTIARYPKITYLSKNEYAGPTSDSAQKTAQSLITRYRGQVDGIFCSNESSTAGMLRVLKDAGLLASRPKP